MINTFLEAFSLLGIFSLALVLALKNVRLFIYVLLFSSVLLHKELFSFFRWDFMPVRAVMLGLLVAAAFKVSFAIRDGKLKEQTIALLHEPLVPVLALLWIVRGASIAFSLNPEASIALFGFFTTVVVLAALLAFHTRGQPEVALHYIKYYLYIAFGLSLFGFFQYFYHNQTGRVIGSFWVIPGNVSRVGSLFWDVNHYGSFIAALLPVSLVLIFLESAKKTRLLFLIISASLLVSLVLTNSRTALLMAASAIGFLIGLLFLRKFGFRGVVYAILIFLLMLVPPVYEYNRKGSPFRTRVKQYLNYRVDSSDSHLLLITGAYQVFEKYPILGGGYGSFFEQFSKTKAAPEYYGRDPAALTNRVPAHTIWGELVAETGIAGLAAYTLLLILLLSTHGFLVLNSEDKKEAWLNAAMFSVLVGWMLAGVFYSYNSEFFWIIMLLFYGYGYNSLRKNYGLSEVVSYFSRSPVPVVLVLLLGAFMIFVGLGKVSLIPWDEAIYAKIAKNMVTGKDYVTQYWVPGKVWYEKPPLFMWTLAGAFRLLGFTDFAAKLPTAVAGFIIIAVTYFFGRKYFGKLAGILSSFSLATTVLYLFYARMAMTDVMCALFITLSLAVYFNRRSVSHLSIVSVLFSGIFLGLGIMTKGVVGFLPLGVIFLYELYLLITRQTKSLKKAVAGMAGILLVSMVVFLPWHVRMYQFYGSNFLKNYIGYHVITRASADIENKEQPIYWYLIVMKVSMRLWFISLLAAFPYALFRAIKQGGKVRDNRLVFFVIWAVFVFLFFSLATSKIVWYITPIYIPLAILNGYFISVMYRFVSQKLPMLARPWVGFLAFYVFIVVILGYTFMVRKMIYVPDTTGSVASLLKLKDSTFGVSQFAYLDRVELPLAYYYTDGPFKIIDFNAEKRERIPIVGFDEKLVLLTKTGRFVETLPEYEYPATVVASEGDYTLWYFPSKRSYYESLLSQVTIAFTDTEKEIISKYGSFAKAPEQFKERYLGLKEQMTDLNLELASH